MTRVQEVDFVAFILSNVRAITFESQCVRTGGPSGRSRRVIKRMYYAD